MGVLDWRPRLRTDVGVALIAFALSLALLIVPEDPGRPVDATAVLLAALSTFPLVVRRQAPVLVFVVVIAASSLLYALSYPAGPPIGPTVAVYNLALNRAAIRGSQALTIAVVAAGYLVHVGTTALQHGVGGAEFVLGIPLWGAAWFAGDRTRLRRERMAELEERALRAEREAERERRLAAAEERTRIARDLHDSAGHAINVILVEAGAARLLQQKDPERARAALSTIETVARETLHEIDQLVRALRDDGGGAGTDGVEPPARLTALETLVQRHRGAGLDVDLHVGGSDRHLPPAVDQAAFRILQESLTNALRHGSGRAEVRLVYAPEALEIDVRNSATAGAVVREGHGLVGMRERAELLGGRFAAGPDNGTFYVRAQLPYESEARA